MSAIDLVSKAGALVMLRDRVIDILPWLRLLLVRNVGLATTAPRWLDPTSQVVATSVLLWLIIAVTGELTGPDPKAPLGMGLIAGAAVGNLASLVAPPAGVIDFLEIGPARWGVVVNIADLALGAGLVLLTRTTYRLIRLLAVKQTAMRSLPRQAKAKHEAAAGAQDADLLATATATEVQP